MRKLIFLFLLESCTINRNLPTPTTVKQTGSGTFVTFPNREGNWLITDTVGNKIKVVPVNIKYDKGASNKCNK